MTYYSERPFICDTVGGNEIFVRPPAAPNVRCGAMLDAVLISFRSLHRWNPCFSGSAAMEQETFATPAFMSLFSRGSEVVFAGHRDEQATR